MNPTQARVPKNHLFEIHTIPPPQLHTSILFPSATPPRTTREHSEPLRLFASA